MGIENGEWLCVFQNNHLYCACVHLFLLFASPNTALEWYKSTAELRCPHANQDTVQNQGDRALLELCMSSPKAQQVSHHALFITHKLSISKLAILWWILGWADGSPQIDPSGTEGPWAASWESSQINKSSISTLFESPSECKFISRALLFTHLLFSLKCPPLKCAWRHFKIEASSQMGLFEAKLWQCLSLLRSVYIYCIYMRRLLTLSSCRVPGYCSRLNFIVLQRHLIRICKQVAGQPTLSTYLYGVVRHRCWFWSACPVSQRFHVRSWAQVRSMPSPRV